MCAPAFAPSCVVPVRNTFGLRHRSFVSPLARVPKRARRISPPHFRPPFRFSTRASGVTPDLEQSAENSPGPAEATPPTSSSSSWLDFANIRKVLGLLALSGFAETTYLTFNKLFSSPGAICSTEGCLEVLSGPFSTFLGIPLTLFGVLAYGIFAYLSFWPLTAKEEEVLVNPNSSETVLLSPEKVYATRDAATRPLLLALSSAMLVYSGYLMTLLVFVIKSMCPYCVFSAVVSLLMFTLTAFVGRAVPSLGSALRIGGAASAIASLGAAATFFLAMPGHILAQPPSEPQAPPAITMQSTKDTMRIAGKLNSKNTKMYGAYWCSHCYDQKQRFGKKAFSKIEYIECDKHGVNTKFKLCREKRIPGYPTWEINGQLYPGEIEIEELERLVGESAD